MFSIRYSEDPHKRRRERIFLYSVGGVAFFIVIGLLFGLVIQLLWNATLAAVFSLPSISFWQAVGLFILAKLFFGFGIGGSGGGARSQRQRRTRAGRGDDASGDVAALSEDETFRKYWQEEGRAAYEAFRQTRKDEGEGGSDDPQQTPSGP